MKKAIAILLFVLLFYNMIGYYLMFAFRHYQVKQAISLKIEQESIASNQLFVIKIPLNLPYLTDWAEYEKVSGSFSYQGRFFEKVKQTIQKDTMIIYCLENQVKKNLYDELDEHTRTQLPDLANNPSGKSEKKSAFNFIKEYLPLSETYFVHSKSYWEVQLTSNYFLGKYAHNLEILIPPPQIA